MKSAAALLLMVICGIGLTIIEKEVAQPEYIDVCRYSEVSVGARLLDSGKYQPELRVSGPGLDVVIDVTKDNAVDAAVMFHDEFGSVRNDSGSVSVSNGSPDEDPTVVAVPTGANGLTAIQITSDDSKRIAMCIIDANKYNKEVK